MFDFLAAKKPKVDDDDAQEKKKPDAAKKPVPLDAPSTSAVSAPVATSVTPAVPEPAVPAPIAVQQELPQIKPTEVSLIL